MLLIHFQIYKKMTALTLNDGISIEPSHVNLAVKGLTKWYAYNGAV